MSGVGCVVALGNCFMPVRIERLAKALLGLDAVLVKQKEQLSKGHLHTLMKLWGAPSCTARTEHVRGYQLQAAVRG